MNRSSSRINKKKVIPKYFQKSQSNSQFLAEANYKHQIKTLKKKNKELVRSLQEAKCRVADHEKALSECCRENTLATVVKLKIKDIVESVKKLVTDLGVVYEELNGKSYDFLGNLSGSHQETRLKIRHPSLSTIEESASMSDLESDLDKENSISIESSTRPTTPTPLFLDADSSQTEIYNVPVVLASEQKRSNVSNEPAVTRSSKSLERNGSVSLDPDSPPTPQLKPFTFPSPKNTTKSTFSKIPVKKNVTSVKENAPLKEVSSNHINRRKTFVFDGKAEEPQKGLQNSGQGDAVVSNSLANEDKSDAIFDRRGTFVLSSLPDNTESDIISDRRGTFLLSSLPDNTESDIVSDRRGTFVLNSVTDDSKPDTVLDRRTTFFIRTNSQEPSNISPPKVIETLNPAQSVAPNQTILLCEDMELTEILPLQTQTQQFISVIPPWNQKLETEKPACVIGQPSCTTSFVKEFPVSNVNSSNQLALDITHGVLKDAEIQNRASIKKVNNMKLLTSNILSETKLLEETLSTNQDVNLADLQQKRNKVTNVEKKSGGKDDVNTNIKCPALKAPSPIAYYTRPDLSVQHKIFESFSAIYTETDNNNEPTSSSGVVAETDNLKESTASKDVFLSSQPAIKETVKKVSESPKPKRRSSRKQDTKYLNFFSDSEESSINLDEDFLPEKRFSLKPGRRIINPNNNKVFVFKKKNTKKQNIDKDSPTNISSDELGDENVKNDLEKDIFNFSASSEADKSPRKKSKGRKSVMPKNNKRSINKQSDVGKRVSRASKKSSKPEINKDEVPVTALPRKSILRLNACNSPIPLRLSSKFARKSVRFSSFPQNEINDPKSVSPIEENVSPVNQVSGDVNNTENVSSHDTRSSQGKRLSVGTKKARSSSLVATGDILKSSNPKLKKSTKRQSSNLGSFEDASESGCSPKKKMCQVSNEIPPENLNHENQVQDIDVKDRYESSQDVTCATSAILEKKSVGRKKGKNSGLPNSETNVKVASVSEGIAETNVGKAKRPFSGVSERRSNKKLSAVDDYFSSDVHEEEATDRKKERNSGGILSELLQNQGANIKDTRSADVIEETKVNETKKSFLLVSERRSNNKRSIADELFPSLNEAISEMVDEEMETAFKLIEDEPTEIYNVKKLIQSEETGCNKEKSPTTKKPKQGSGRVKKKSSKRKTTSLKQTKDKENTPYSVESNLKLDVLTSDNDLYTLFDPKECLKKSVAKPKTARKIKESIPLFQNDIKVDVLVSEDTRESDGAVGGRSRRNRKVVSMKEPSLHCKMRREK